MALWLWERLDLLQSLLHVPNSTLVKRTLIILVRPICSVKVAACLKSTKTTGGAIFLNAPLLSLVVIAPHFYHHQVKLLLHKFILPRQAFKKFHYAGKNVHSYGLSSTVSLLTWNTLPESPIAYILDDEAGALHPLIKLKLVKSLFTY